jgi:N-succinyldiaminopimelate aminotransferase
MSSRQPPFLSARLQGFGTTVFTEMTRLAIEHQRREPGARVPRLRRARCDQRGGDRGDPRRARTSTAGWLGIPPLTAAIAGHQRRFYGLEYDPEAEITAYARGDRGDLRGAHGAV